MTRWFDKLKLSAQERRLVLGGTVVLALLLNYWLVWPYFGELPKVTAEIERLRREQTRFSSEISQKARYERRIQELRSQGAQVLGEDMANRVQQSVYNEASTAGVTITRLVPILQPARTGNRLTNDFFIDNVVNIDVLGGEAELVDFLYRLGASESMIRVRDIKYLRLDPSQTRLSASLDLVASFPKKISTNAPARAQAPSPAKTPASAGARPASTGTNPPPRGSTAGRPTPPVSR
ncbi:MAG: hypothetical protein ACKOET_14745 [Verrucomicrobiota bacterium]